MLYIKKIFNDEGENLNLIEAKIAMDEGQYLSVAIAQKTPNRDVKTSFVVNKVTKIIEVEGCFIIKTAENEVFPTAGWDDNSRTIKILYFMDFTDTKRVFKIEEAMEAVEKGHDIRARSYELQTSPIKAFLDEKSFETRSGSVYEIV